VSVPSGSVISSWLKSSSLDRSSIRAANLSCCDCLRLYQSSPTLIVRRTALEVSLNRLNQPICVAISNQQLDFQSTQSDFALASIPKWSWHWLWRQLPRLVVALSVLLTRRSSYACGGARPAGRFATSGGFPGKRRLSKTRIIASPAMTPVKAVSDSF